MDQPWQVNKSLSDTNEYMFDNEILCDITFLTGESKTPVKAHKYMLASRSPVFFAMFCGPIFEPGETVDIPDIHPKILRHLLRYIYTEDCHVEEENVMDLLYCSKKYHVPMLEEECKEFINKNICPENACSILPQAIMFDEQELVEKCKQLIIVYPSRSLKSDGFESLPKETVKDFLATNELFDIDEVQIYGACKRWATKQCEDQDLETSPENLRKCLGDILYLIRFPAMTQENFANHVTGDGILSDREIISIYEHFAVKKSLDYFKSEKRMLDMSKILTLDRFKLESCNTVSKKFCNTWYVDYFGFYTNMNAYLVGVSLFMPVESLTYKCKFQFQDCTKKKKIGKQNVILNNNKTKFEDWMLENPMFVHKGNTYVIGIRGSYGTPSGLLKCDFCQQVFVGDKCNRVSCGRGRAMADVYWGKDEKRLVQVEELKMNTIEIPQHVKNDNISTGLLHSCYMIPAKF